MGQNKFYTDLDSLLMPVHGAWCMVHARCRARRCEEGAIQLSTSLGTNLSTIQCKPHGRRKPRCLRTRSPPVFTPNQRRCVILYSNIHLVVCKSASCGSSMFWLPYLYTELTRVWFDVTIDINTILLQWRRSTPVAQSAPRNLLTRWDVSSIPANGIFLTKN